VKEVGFELFSRECEREVVMDGESSETIEG